MMPAMNLSQYTLVLLMFLFVVVVVLLWVDKCRTRSNTKQQVNGDLPEPPSPMRLPIIGHLHLLGGYEVPYQAFTNLGKKFGNVVRLHLGSVKCVVVNEQKNIREALVTKGHHFDSRPNFERYQRLFCGNKENSLAFCNWSVTQKKRRDMLRVHTFPRAFTNNFNSLDNLISNSVQYISSHVETEQTVDLKPIILQQCASIFAKHFCTKTFGPSDEKFIRMVDNFDDIFYEVNQGYAADFLPFLMPLHSKNLKRIANLTHSIRDFVTDEIIGDRFNTFNPDDEPKDYVESLIKHVKTEGDSGFSWETALFALEDIIGGHSAVGNFMVKMFGFLVNEPEVQQKIQNEIDQAVGGKGIRNVNMTDRGRMPYTEAAIFEAIRLIASPIVPRVANRDSCIGGYKIEKDTVIFLNNYDLSMSEKLWEQPEKFMPERFIKENRLSKPEHFLPFGGGRRSCMGYKMVLLISFGILGGLLQNFKIEPVPSEKYHVPIGSLALPKNTFKFRFSRRD